MDDMLFHNNAKNNIYVLNTSYNKSYDLDNLSRLGSSNRCGNNEFQSEESSRENSSTLSLCSLTQSCYSTTAAIQKLFNYSTEHFTNNCGSKSSVLNRRNCNNNRCNGCSNEYSQQHQSFHGGGGSIQVSSNSAAAASAVAPNKTTSSNVNSSICAKKKKFLKYLEEEKLRKLSVENLSTTNCERSSIDGRNSGSSTTNSMRFFKTNGVHSNKSNSSKSSNELYQEAVEILGLTCTLCDNCRCLDCQSRYFECDDSDLFMGDCYEYSVASDEQDDDIEECSFYKYSIQQSENCNSNSMSFRSSDGNSSNNILATSHIATTNISHSQENILHGNCMGMCDKGIQYDESLFVQNDENEENDEEKKAQVPGAAIPEVNND